MAKYQHEINRGPKIPPKSFILNSLNILVAMYILVRLLNAEEYLSLVILLIIAILCFRQNSSMLLERFRPAILRIFRISKPRFWMLLALLVYFVLRKYWLEGGLLFVYIIVETLSLWLWAEDRSLINAFEGMYGLRWILALRSVFFALALVGSGFTSIISWILFSVFTLLEATGYYYRLKCSWRKIHFPLMVRYAGIAGHYAGTANSKKKELPLREVLKHLLQSIYSLFMKDHEEIDDMLDSAEQKMFGFKDRAVLEKLLKENCSNLNKKELPQFLDKIGVELTSQKNQRLYVNYVIGEVISREYGERERGKYIYAVISGKAG